MPKINLFAAGSPMPAEELGAAPDDPIADTMFNPIPVSKRHRWTVHTTQEKRMELEHKSKFTKYWEGLGANNPEGLLPIISESSLCGSRKLSSLVGSFCSSKGLPYYTELAFEEMEGNEGVTGPSPAEEDEGEKKSLEKEDKYNVLKQIETPKDNGLLE